MLILEFPDTEIILTAENEAAVKQLLKRIPEVEIIIRDKSKILETVKANVIFDI